MKDFDLLHTPLAYGVTLIEASAGTGKTHALRGIYLRLLVEHGLTVSQILVTTYTVAATAELRDRIRSALEQVRRVLDGDSTKDPLYKKFAALPDRSAVRMAIEDALRDFDEAAIHTIHGFCQRLLRERAFESGTVFDAELTDEQGAEMLQVAQDFWRTEFSGAKPFYVALALSAKLSPGELASSAKSAIHKHGLLLRPGSSARAMRLAELERMLDILQAEWPAWRSRVAPQLGPDNAWSTKDKKKIPKLLTALEALDALAEGSFDIPDHLLALADITPEGLQKLTLKKAMPPQHPCYEWCEAFVATLKVWSAATRCAFIEHAKQTTFARRGAAGLMSFDDLLTQIHATLESPRGKALEAAVRERFHAALVDEFQDTDPVQDAIFHRCMDTAERRLMLIGDPKQAIYGFRGADVFTYLRAADKAHYHYTLSTNYRSAAALVQAVNTLFQRNPFLDTRIQFHPAKSAGQTDQTPLLAGERRAPFRFWLSAERDPIALGTFRAQVPERTASAILEMLESGITIGGKPLKPGNLAVLCPKNDQAQAICDALLARNVPAVVLSQQSVFLSAEAEDLRLLLAAIAEPQREGFVRAALATETLGWNASALDAAARDAGQWECITSHFHDAHALWKEWGLNRMMRDLFNRLHLRERLLRKPDGERKLTNLLQLTELLHAAEMDSRMGTAALLRWFDEQRHNERSGEAAELRLERDDEAVRVTTIHKSKGLQYDVVICPYLWEKTSSAKKQQEAYWHDHERAVLDLQPDEESQNAAQRESFDEELRKLYVALTRARHECYVIWGHIKDAEKSALAWLLHPHRWEERDKPIDGVEMEKNIHRLATENPTSFAWEPLPELQHRRYHPANPAPLSARPADFQGTIDTRWRVASFTALVDGAEGEGGDYDGAQREDRQMAELQGIHAFPRGKKPGVCVHEVFERLDFTTPSDLEDLVRSRLAIHNLNQAGAAESLCDAVRACCEVELLPGLSLAQVPFRHTLREVEFHLPAKLLTAANLEEFAGAGLCFSPRMGILKGFIDLVFEHKGQFHMVDWKTNWLGPDALAYDAATMATEMKAHRYGLQWRLYLTALHRFLRSRLREYDPAEHLGGAFYVFIRGVTPGNPQLGIVRGALSMQELSRLDALFSSRP